MKKYLLDTQVMIGFWKGKKTWVDFISKNSGLVGTSVVCVAELYEGIFLGQRPREEREKIEEFIANLAFVAEIDRKTAEKFGELRANLRKKGKIISDFDILIAAASIENNFILVTENKKHFSRISELEIY